MSSHSVVGSLPPSHEPSPPPDDGKIAATAELTALRQLLLEPALKQIEALRRRIEILEQSSYPPAPASAPPSATHPPLNEDLASHLATPTSPQSAHTIHHAHWFTRLGRAASDTLARLSKDDGQILDVLLIHRIAWCIIERRSRPRPDALTAPIAAMLQYLHEQLRDETLLAHYERQGSVHVDDLTYGIHVGPLAVMLSVISGRNPGPALATCRENLAQLHEKHAGDLIDYNPERPLSSLLPPDFVE